MTLVILPQLYLPFYMSSSADARQIKFSVCSKLLFMTNKPHGVPASAELVKKYMIAC